MYHVTPVARLSFGLRAGASHFRAGPQQLIRTCAFNTATVTSDKVIGNDVNVVELAPQGKRWEKVDQWVMFSDLHVSTKTLKTCLEVLQKVKHEATKRKAGVLFLGEFLRCMLSPHSQYRTHTC